MCTLQKPDRRHFLKKSKFKKYIEIAASLAVTIHFGCLAVFSGHPLHFIKKHLDLLACVEASPTGRLLQSSHRAVAVCVLQWTRLCLRLPHLLLHLPHLLDLLRLLHLTHLLCLAHYLDLRCLERRTRETVSRPWWGKMDNYLCSSSIHLIFLLWV